MNEALSEIMWTAERAVAGSEADKRTLAQLLSVIDLTGVGESDDRAYLAVLSDWLGMREQAMLALRPTGSEHRDGARMPNLAGMLASGHGDYDRARELFLQALSAAWDDTSLRAKILANLAALSLLAGEVMSASEWLGRADNAGVQVRDPATDVLLASTQFGIARELGDLPGLREAVSRLNGATRTRVAELGSDHPLALTTVASLAAAEFELAAIEESIENQERALAVLEVAAHRLAADLGADHPQALSCLENLCTADLRLALASGSMDRAQRAAHALESVSRRIEVGITGQPKAVAGGPLPRSAAAQQEVVLGIDLGITNSCVALIDDAGQSVIVKSTLGDDTTPSVVCFESPRRAIVGRAAKNLALIAPELVAQQVKRDMGTDTQYTFGGARHTPETISALILRELTRAAGENTGHVVSGVVITVPAYFGVAEREATRLAGQLAGLTVLDVLAEPVAALLHYQAAAPGAAGTRHILIYDLGGATFDTTVIRLDGNDISVICTDGDAHLGGAEWDQVIADYLLDQFAAEHNGLRPREDAAFMRDLLIAAEQLKQALSKARSRWHIIRFGGVVTQVELTRETLEELTADLLERTVVATERTITTARSRGISHIDDVLLVGGMTRMPAIARVLQDRLSLSVRIHEPDLAVAKGAALFALLCMVRSGGDTPDTGKTAEEAAADTGPAVSAGTDNARMRVTTVLPRSFGVKGIDGRDPLALTDPARARQIIVHLLPADTPLPANTGPYTFHTSFDNQRMVAIEVWEQAGAIESEELSANRKIGEAMLKNLPPRLPAQTPIEVTFFMSGTGQLTVRAVEPGSGIDLLFDLQLAGLDAASLDQARQAVASYQLGLPASHGPQDASCS